MHALVNGASARWHASDLDVNVLVYEPDTEVWMHGMLGVGVEGCFRGDGVRALYGEIDEVFDRWSVLIDRLVDGGDRIAIRGDFVGYGRLSGAKTELTSGGTMMELSARQDRAPGVVRRAGRLAARPRRRRAVGVGSWRGPGALAAPLPLDRRPVVLRLAVHEQPVQARSRRGRRCPVTRTGTPRRSRAARPPRQGWPPRDADDPAVYAAREQRGTRRSPG